MNNHTIRRLEQLEARMGTRDDVPRFRITLDYVEACEGAPTGRVTRVRHDSSGQVIDRQELFIDPATLRASGGKR